MVVLLAAARVSSGAPHDEQKFDPSGFRCPQLLQKTSAIGTRPLSPSIELPVRGRVEQRVELRRVGRLDHADPALAVRVVVEPLAARRPDRR